MTEKSYDISRLLDFYGELLTERQRLAARLYYDDDLSLSEVAQELGISRQGVRASLKKSEEALESMEEKLGLAERFDKTLGIIESLREAAKNAAEQCGGSDEAPCGLARKVIELTNEIENDI